MVGAASELIPSMFRIPDTGVTYVNDLVAVTVATLVGPGLAGQDVYATDTPVTGYASVCTVLVGLLDVPSAS